MNGLPSQFYLIGNAIRNAEQNHRVISQNIANVNTPGYKTQQMDFDEFQAAIAKGQGAKQLIDSLPVETVEDLVERMDGNNVDIDAQLAELKKNSLMFQTYSHLLASQMGMIRRAISG